MSFYPFNTQSIPIQNHNNAVSIGGITVTGTPTDSQVLTFRTGPDRWTPENSTAGAECSYRLNIDPTGSVDPFTGGRVITVPGQVDLPLTTADQGLGNANGFRSDPSNILTFVDGGTTILVNTAGNFLISFQIPALSNLLTPGNFIQVEVLLNGQMVFADPPMVAGGENFMSNTTSPISGVFNIIADTASECIVQLNAGDVLVLRFYLQFDTCVIPPTSNMSITHITPGIGPQGPVGPAGPAATTIYNGDGTIAASRNVDVGTFLLSLGTALANRVTIDGGSQTIGVQADNNINILSNTQSVNLTAAAATVNISTPQTIINSATVNLQSVPPTDLTDTDLLTRNSATGNVEIRTVASLPLPSGGTQSIAYFNNSGTLSSDNTDSKYDQPNKNVAIASPSLTLGGTKNVIVGGDNNSNTGTGNVIVGGQLNTINSPNSANVILGGENSSIGGSSYGSAIVAGQNCTINGNGGTIVGGNQSSCSGSFAFMFSDSQAVANVNAQNDCAKWRLSNGMSITDFTFNPVLLAPSILQCDSNTKGFLPPRMTTGQKNAIAAPAAGLIVFDNTINKLCVFSGIAWETITSV